MRVTLVNLHPKGGMLHYACELANALAQFSEVEVSVVFSRAARRDLLDPGVSRIDVDLPKSSALADLIVGLPHLLDVRQVSRAVMKTRPSVVHFTNSHVFSDIQLRSLSRHFPLVRTVHDVVSHLGEERRNFDKKRGRMFRYFGKIVVHREDLRQRILTMYPHLTADRVAVSPHGDYRLFLRWAGSRSREPRRVLFFGRIREYKGIQHFIAAAPLVRAAVGEVTFAIVGFGDLRPFHRALSDQSLFEVHNSHIPDEAVSAQFEAASLLVLPYLEASESGVMKIAKGFDLPVIATDLEAFRHAIDDGETGVLVRPADPEKLAEAISTLLLNDTKRAAIAQKAKERNDDGGSWVEAARRLIKIYRDLCDQVSARDIL